MSDEVPAALPPNLILGTSSFSSADWVGRFYPPETRPEQFLGCYAQHFPAVEIDATFYGVPKAAQVARWKERTPDAFIFAAKVPQTVTHSESPESLRELDEFLDVMRGLGSKLGPLVFQFAYVPKGREPDEYATGSRFLSRLDTILERLPDDIRYVIEVRNERWVAPPLLDRLRERRIALAFIDYYTTPAMSRIAARAGATTAEFAYVRFLGHHKEMDSVVEEKFRAGGKRWDEVVRDRRPEMAQWIPALRALTARMTRVYAFFNNHYAGYAPGSIDLLRAMWGGS